VYVDSDLLVAPSEYARAEHCMTRLGFRQLLADSDVPGSQVAGHPWCRADGASVDLHWTIAGVRAAPGAVWSVLSEATRTVRVGGVDVQAPSIPMCAVIVALHAAHHGRAVYKPLEDLGRAVDRLDPGTWAAAAHLAARLGATDAFTSGLMLHPAGRRLATELSLPTHLPLELRLKAADPPPGAVTLHVLASTSGLRPRMWLVARKLVPTRRFMRVWFPRSALGGSWMVAGYFWRPAWVTLKAGPALLAWLRNRDAGAIMRGERRDLNPRPPGPQASQQHASDAWDCGDRAENPSRARTAEQVGRQPGRQIADVS
jgi:hypothetical protein